MLIEQITQALTAVRQQKPLVVNITNYVVMNNTANALLAIGASPIMAHSKQEMAEMMSFAGALVINIGTLDSVWTPRMSYAVEQARGPGSLQMHLLDELYQLDEETLATRLKLQVR